MTVYIDPYTGLQYDLPDVTGGQPDTPLAGVGGVAQTYSQAPPPPPPGTYTTIEFTPTGELSLKGTTTTGQPVSVPIAGAPAVAITNTLQGYQQIDLPGIVGEANIPVTTTGSLQSGNTAMSEFLAKLLQFLKGFGAGSGISLTTLLLIMAISGKRMDTKTLLLLTMMGGTTGGILSMKMPTLGTPATETQPILTTGVLSPGTVANPIPGGPTAPFVWNPIQAISLIGQSFGKLF